MQTIVDTNGAGGLSINSLEMTGFFTDDGATLHGAAVRNADGGHTRAQPREHPWASLLDRMVPSSTRSRQRHLDVDPELEESGATGYRTSCRSGSEHVDYKFTTMTATG